MLKITKRTATFEDVLSLKKVMPFSKFRRKSKGINFSCEFGAAGVSVGTQLKEHYQFTEEDCNETISSLGLERVLAQELSNKRKGELDADVKYRICGTAFRNKFFNTYPGLMRRIVREQKLARQDGFTRTWSGPVRHHSEIRYMKFSKDGNLLGADKSLYSRMYGHLKNNAANTAIQTAEVIHAMPDIVAIQSNLNDWGFRSFVFNYIHDSLEMAIYKPEVNVIFALANKVATTIREPSGNLPIYLEAELGDYDKGGYFKHGDEISIKKYDIEIELAKYNESFQTDHKYTDYLPFTEEGRKNVRNVLCNYGLP